MCFSSHYGSRIAIQFFVGLIVIFLLDTSVRADPTIDGEKFAFYATINTTRVILSASAGIGGVVMGALEAKTIAKGEIPSDRGSIYGGYAISGLNIAFGTINLAYFYPYMEDNLSLGLGIANLAIGAIDLGLTIANHVRYHHRLRKWSLVPVVGKDTAGGTYAGLNFQFASF